MTQARHQGELSVRDWANQFRRPCCIAALVQISILTSTDYSRLSQQRGGSVIGLFIFFYSWSLCIFPSPFEMMVIIQTYYSYTSP